MKNLKIGVSAKTCPIKPLNYKEERIVLIHHQILKTGIKLKVWKGAFNLLRVWDRSCKDLFG